MHDNKNPTPDGDVQTTSGHHREGPERVHVGCLFSNPIYSPPAGVPGKHAKADDPQARAS